MAAVVSSMREAASLFSSSKEAFYSANISKTLLVSAISASHLAMSEVNY